MFYVYILECSDKSTYIGCSNNIKERIERHSKAQIQATQGRLPVKLVVYFAFNNKYIAYDFEKYLKSGSGKAFMSRHFFKS